jgi:FkbM family methyltransferase
MKSRAKKVFLHLLRKWRTRRSAFREYGYEVRSFLLPQDGAVRYAQWLHPKERKKEITQRGVDEVRRFVRTGDTVIDIGAHTGDTTVPMAIAAGPTGCTLALEPNPHVFEVLKVNARLNPEKTNIVPLNYAATKVDGKYTFHYSDAAYCNGGYLSSIDNQEHGHWHALEVQGINLDQFLRRNFLDRLSRLTFIKIDTEGYDRDVICSIMSILREFRPVLMVEVLLHLTETERDGLFNVLAEGDYDCFRYAEGLEVVGEQLGRSDMLRWGHFDIIAVPKEAGSTSLWERPSERSAI